MSLNLVRRDSPKPTELAFLSFLILVTVSVVTTARMGHDQDQDVLVINLVGRQRMLALQITSQALQMQWGENKDEHRRIRATRKPLSIKRSRR